MNIFSQILNCYFLVAQNTFSLERLHHQSANCKLAALSLVKSQQFTILAVQLLHFTAADQPTCLQGAVLPWRWSPTVFCSKIVRWLLFELFRFLVTSLHRLSMAFSLIEVAFFTKRSSFFATMLLNTRPSKSSIEMLHSFF